MAPKARLTDGIDFLSEMLSPTPQGDRGSAGEKPEKTPERRARKAAERVRERSSTRRELERLRTLVEKNEQKTERPHPITGDPIAALNAMETMDMQSRWDMSVLSHERNY